MAERKSNLELLRIICMLILIGHHCIVHGTGVPSDNPLVVNKLFALLMIPAGKMCFMAFLALSTWFMVDQTFKTKRFLKVWLQVFFYSVLLTVLFVIITNEPLSIAQWISAFLPIIGNSHGFAAAYLALYLLLPFLRKITLNSNRKQIAWMIILLIYFQMISQYVGNITGYFQRFPSEISLFILCFFLSYYLKKWTPRFLNNIYITGGIFILCWLGMWGIYIIQYKFPNIAGINYLIQINGDEFGFINILSGYMMFFTFKNLKMKTHIFINTIAKSMFGVLLIHDHNFLRPVVWFNIIKTQNWLTERFFILYVLLTILLIFIAGILIDKFREQILEKNIFKWKFIESLSNKMDSLIL